MQLVIAPSGTVSCIYGEVLCLASLGSIAIRRGSYVEPDERGNWYVDLSPVDGPQLGPFSNRSSALQAEVAWLETRWLVPAASDQ